MFTKLEPCLKPVIGCLNCGAGEMKGDKQEITASMHTRIYQGFGGWLITKNDKLIFMARPNLEWHQFPTLMKFENMARKDPDNDWRAECQLPLRDATYQRQGKNRWVLVKSGLGFA